MMADAPDTRTAQELVQYLRGRGITTAEIASELHRSPRMVRKILSGESSGALYRSSLSELATTGKMTHVPPRRRHSDGSLVAVRGKNRDGKAKTVTPDDPGGTYTDQKQGGRMQISTSYMGEGGRIVHVKVPKGKDAKGRGTASKAILDVVRRAAKGQAGDKQKQITTRITFSNGRQMEVNTYNASTMLKRLHEAGDDTFKWLATEQHNRYTNLDTSDTTITGVALNIVQVPKTEAYQKEQARGRKRRTRKLTDAETQRQQERERLDEEKNKRRRRGGKASS